MKVATPAIFHPKAQDVAAMMEQPQEQPRQPMTASDKQESSFANYVEKTVEKTVVIAEKSVNAVDPLNIFAPNDIPERLVLQEGLFNGTASYPILEARTNFSFHNLEITASGNKLTIEDSSTGKPVIVIERKGAKAVRTYKIYKTSPGSEGREPAKTNEGVDLYPLASVQRRDTSTTDLEVIMDGQTDPTYILEKAGIPANYATKYFVKQVGEKEEVASTHPWEGNDYMLVVKEGLDATLMLCFAVITDDTDMPRPRRESFSKMMHDVNPTKMFRKQSDPSDHDK